MLGAITGDLIGSALEASPVKTRDFERSPPGAGFTDDTVLAVAARRAAVTHNHVEGITRAQATALAVFLVRFGEDKATP